MASVSTPEEAGKKSFLSMFFIKAKPPTIHNVMFYYIPVQGVVSYSALSVHVLNPSLVLRILPKRDLTNALLLTSVVGTGLYIYDKKHLSTANIMMRCTYSTFGALIFSFGSLLLWAVMRIHLPESVIMRTICGVTSALGLVKVGASYLEFVDSQVNVVTSK